MIVTLARYVAAAAGARVGNEFWRRVPARADQSAASVPRVLGAAHHLQGACRSLAALQSALRQLRCGAGRGGVGRGRAGQGS